MWTARRSLRVTFHNVISGQKAPLRRILRNFRLRTPNGTLFGVTSCSPVGHAQWHILYPEAGQTKKTTRWLEVVYVDSSSHICGGSRGSDHCACLKWRHRKYVLRMPGSAFPRFFLTIVVVQNVMFFMLCFNMMKNCEFWELLLVCTLANSFFMEGRVLLLIGSKPEEVHFCFFAFGRSSVSH
jgi:hypothetical protein